MKKITIISAVVYGILNVVACTSTKDTIVDAQPIPLPPAKPAHDVYEVAPNTSAKTSSTPVAFSPRAELKRLDKPVTVYFEASTKGLTASQKRELEALVPTLRATAGTIRIEGYDDRSASASRSFAVGMQRAQLVKQFLVKKGLPSSKITTTSFGHYNVPERKVVMHIK